MCEKMSEVNTEANKKMNEKTKCNLKCSRCHYYSKDNDTCEEKGIENCSEHVHTDFSQCDSFLVDAKFVMF